MRDCQCELKRMRCKGRQVVQGQVNNGFTLLMRYLIWILCDTNSMRNKNNDLQTFFFKKITLAHRLRISV